MTTARFRNVRSEFQPQKPPTPEPRASGNSLGWWTFVCMMLIIIVFVVGLVVWTNLREQQRELTRRIRACEQTIGQMGDQKKNVALELELQHGAVVGQMGRMNISLKKRNADQVRRPEPALVSLPRRTLVTRHP